MTNTEKLKKTQNLLLNSLRSDRLALIDMIYRSSHDLYQKTLNINFDLQEVSHLVLNNNIVLIDQLEMLMVNTPTELKQGYTYQKTPFLMSHFHKDGYVMEDVMTTLRYFAIEKRRELEINEKDELREFYWFVVNVCTTCLTTHLESMRALEKAKGRELGADVSRIGMNAADREQQSKRGVLHISVAGNVNIATKERLIADVAKQAEGYGFDCEIGKNL